MTVAEQNRTAVERAAPSKGWVQIGTAVLAPVLLVCFISWLMAELPLPAWAWVLVYTCGGILTAMLLIAAIVSRERRRVIYEFAQFVRAVGRGESPARLSELAGGPLAGLGRELNAAAEKIGSGRLDSHRESNALRDILFSVNHGIIAVDNRQMVVFTNPKAGDLLDFDSSAAVGKALWEVLPSEPILRAVIDAADTGSSRIFPVSARAGRHLELSVSRLMASPASAMSAAGGGGAVSPRPPLAMPAPSESGVVIVAHDTTRSVRYQELRKEFVANVSHELRTPLTVIKGFTETLADGALTDPVNGPKFLATIGRHVDQLTNLVDDLLEVSRLESSPELPRPQNLDLAAVVRKCAELLLPAAQKKSQSLSVEIIGLLSRVLGNPDYLHRAVANLVDNAIKYTPEGGAITVRASAEQDAVIVEVTDNGIGIAAAELDRVFERFYRVDRSRSREMGGTGLGLSIVKHVAQAHGGSIDVTSTPGQGSTFLLKIPRPIGD